MLSPQQFAQLVVALTRSQRRFEAVIALDARGGAPRDAVCAQRWAGAEPAGATSDQHRNYLRPFCGSASRNLRGYGRWHVALKNSARTCLANFKTVLKAAQNTNTLG